MGKSIKNKEAQENLHQSIASLRSETILKGFHLDFQEQVCALEDSRERLQTILDSVSDAIIACDPETSAILDANQRIAELLGYTPEEATEMHLNELVVTNGEDETESSFQSFMAKAIDGKPQLFEQKIRRKDGTVVWAHISLKMAAYHAQPFLLAIMHDISDRMRAVEALQESEHRARMFFEEMHNGCALYEVVFDNFNNPVDIRYIEVNRAHEESTGLKASSIIGKTVLEIMPQTEDYWIRNLIYVAVTGESLHLINYAREIGRYFDVNAFCPANGFVAVTFEDITERKIAEDSLRESENKYRSLFEDAAISLWEEDFSEVKRFFDQIRAFGISDFREYFLSHPDKVRECASLIKVLDVNHMSLELFGAETKQDLCQNLGRYFLASSWPVFTEMIIALAEGQTRFSGEIPVRDLFCRYLLLDLRLSVAPIHTETLARVMVSFQDITEQKQAQEALKVSEERFRSLVETTSDWIWEVDANGLYTYASPKVYDLLGYQPDEVIGKSPLDLMPEEERTRLASDVARIMAEGKPVRNYENLNLHKDGHLVMLETNGIPIFDPGNRLKGYRGIDRDITHRKQAEEALRESEDRLRIATETAGIGIWNWEIQNDQLYWSEKCKSIFGLPSDIDMTYAVFLSAVHPLDRRNVDETVNLALEEHKEYKIETRSLWPDGTIRWVLSIGNALYDSHGKPIRMQGVAIDITERKQQEESLRKLAEELRRSNKELEHFAYITTHDLQEPVRTIRVFLQMLETRYKGQLDDQAEEYIRFAVDGAGRLYHLVNDLLDYSRLGVSPPSPEPTDANAALDQALQSLNLLIKEKQALVTHDPLPRVMAHQDQLSLVFQNLINNAIKFRSDSPPSIHISAWEEDSQCIFAIRDNGIGIDARHFERIFVIFKRLHGPGKYPGTGIGLSICKRIIEHFGGRIWVESKAGEGSTFFFSLPRA